jgi:hypothetical protein
MVILYGNDAAVNAARKGQGYPAGSELALVTWAQKEDDHWYGANVPDSIVSIERFKSGDVPGARLTQERIAYLTGLKASVTP